MSAPAASRYRPRYSITPAMVRSLSIVERAKATLEHFPLPVAVEQRLKHEARVRAAHNSTWIENRALTLADARAIIEDKTIKDPTRQREAAARELRNYWAALDFVDRAVEKPMTERLVRELHAIILRGTTGAGRPPQASEYRAVNVQVGEMEYLPPEAKDVPALMDGLVEWIAEAEREELPGPILAGLAAYQFVTIHPFEDGNGRTTRALATLLLARSGYGLGGLARMEEFYTRDVERYYESLQMGMHHNYYFANERGSRSDPDLTEWLAYFLEMLAAAAEETRAAIVEEVEKRGLRPADPLADLTPRLRRLVGHVAAPDARFTPADLSEWFGVTTKTARDWLVEWRSEGRVEPDDPNAERVRAWRLSASFRAKLEEAGVFR